MDHNPALSRFPTEAAIIGKMVVGFGELEYMVCNIAGMALNNSDVMFKALYRLRATSARINTADTLMQPAFRAVNMANEQAKAFAAVRYCLRIRNQYAHCNWADGLFFTDLQKSAGREEWFHDWQHVDLPLLETQEAYFGHTRIWLFYLEYELRFKRGTLDCNPVSVPAELSPPPLYNPASEHHVPPWISNDDKARHIARALETANQPTREPSDLRLTREEWAAKDAKEVREGGRPAE